MISFGKAFSLLQVYDTKAYYLIVIYYSVDIL